MKVWKRNAVVAAIVLFVCVAVYLNWSYQSGETRMRARHWVRRPGERPDQRPAGGRNGSEPRPGILRLARGRDHRRRELFRLGPSEPAAGAGQRPAILQDSIANESADETMKEANGEAIQTLASYTVSEAQIENLVTAKGYTDCVALSAMRASAW